MVTASATARQFRASGAKDRLVLAVTRRRRATAPANHTSPVITAGRARTARPRDPRGTHRAPRDSTARARYTRGRARSHIRERAAGYAHVRRAREISAREWLCRQPNAARTSSSPPRRESRLRAPYRTPVQRERHYKAKRVARNVDFVARDAAGLLRKTRRAQNVMSTSSAWRQPRSDHLIFLPGASWPFCFSTIPVTLPLTSLS